MLIREILEESVQKFGEVKAVKWLNRKEVLERSYSEMLRNVISIRKGLFAEDFAGKHIALIGTSSVEWIEVIWELLQDVLQRCRWMQHSHVKN